MPSTFSETRSSAVPVDAVLVGDVVLFAMLGDHFEFVMRVVLFVSRKTFEGAVSNK